MPDSIHDRDLGLEMLIQKFQLVAPEEIRRFFPTPNNCVAAVRIIEQIFQKFGADVRPLPCRYICHAPALEKVYIAAPHDAEWERRFRKQAIEIRDDRVSAPWQGHLIALVSSPGTPGYWVLDPTWMAAGPYLGFSGELNGCLAARMPLSYDPDLDCVAFDIEADGVQLKIQYEPLDDSDYETLPAWELDHLEPVIALLWRRMQGGAPEQFAQFVIYRRPRDFPFASIVVRRHVLVGDKIVPDAGPAMVLGGREDKALEFARQRLREKGLIRWERFDADNPVIVEVWF